MKRKKPPIRRGFKLVHTPPCRVVGIVKYKNRVIIATEEGVYEFKDDALVKIPLVYMEKTNDAT